MNKPRTTRLIALAAALCLGGAALLACQSKDAANAAASATHPALTGQTTPVESASVAMTLNASGNIIAWQDISISSQSNGLRLAELRANVGDTVRKGQVLAVFSPETINAEVLQAQANLLSAQAQAADARSNAERARSIAGTGALSEQQINQMNTAAKATAAQVQAARAIVQLQKTRQGYTRVIAPDDGVISARNATVGAVLPAGMEMFRMVRQGRLEWRAEVAGKDLARIQPGQTATITTTAGGTVQGRVRSVSPVLDPMKRIGTVYVDLQDAQAAGARAGMYANGSFKLGQMQGMLVPQSAVLARDGFNYVFVVGADNKVHQRQIETGARVDDKVQVLKGLEGGAAIVRSGVSFLADGDVVRVENTPPTVAASAPGAGARSAPSPTPSSAGSAPQAAASQPL